MTDKHGVTDNAKIQEIIAEVEAEMNGKKFVRPSGTEPIVRVMAEAPDVKQCDQYVERIVAVVKAEMGLEE